MEIGDDGKLRLTKPIWLGFFSSLSDPLERKSELLFSSASFFRCPEAFLPILSAFVISLLGTERSGRLVTAINIKDIWLVSSVFLSWATVISFGLPEMGPFDRTSYPLWRLTFFCMAFGITSVGPGVFPCVLLCPTIVALDSSRASRR